MAGGAAGMAIGRSGLRAIRNRRRWPGWWPTRCTAVDPHPRPRDLHHQSRRVGRRRTGRPGPGRLSTDHPAPDRAEQDPADWWPAVVAACAGARAAAPEAFAAVEAVGFAAARQTLVPVTAAGEPLGPALVWSDRRATARGRGDGRGDSVGWTPCRPARGPSSTGRRWRPRRPGWRPTNPTGWPTARWLLTPRDLVVWQHDGGGGHRHHHGVGRRSVRRLGPARGGLLAALGRPAPAGARPRHRGRGARPGPAAELGLRAGIPVVVGAGRPGLRGPGHGRHRRPARWSPGGPRPTSRSRWPTSRSPSPTP